MEEAPVYERIWDVVQSDAAYEKFTSAIGLGDLLEKPEGEDLQTEKPMESYTIICANKTYGRKTQLTYETVNDAQKPGNILTETVGTWGTSAPRTKDKYYADFFNYGAVTTGNAIFDNSITGVIDDATGLLTYDNKCWFAASGATTGHLDKVGNNYGNYTQTRALSHDNLKTTYTTYTTTNNRDERANHIVLTPDTLLIPPALRFTAQVILQTTNIPGSADNDTNVLSAIVNPIEWHHLTDTDGWFLGKVKQGLMATDRLDVTIDFWQDYSISPFISKDVMKNWANCWELSLRDNQQPSLNGNILEGSEANSRFLTDDAEEGNGNKSTQHLSEMMIWSELTGDSKKQDLNDSVITKLETNKDYYASILTRFGGCITNWRSNSQGLSILKDIVNNGVNCLGTPKKIRTISSRAWKVISLKVQRLALDSYRLIRRVIEPRVPCILFG